MSDFKRQQKILKQINDKKKIIVIDTLTYTFIVVGVIFIFIVLFVW